MKLYYEAVFSSLISTTCAAVTIHNEAYGWATFFALAAICDLLLKILKTLSLKATR